MPRGQRFPLEVMLRAMREVDNGVPVSVVCRKIGMAENLLPLPREVCGRGGNGGTAAA